MAEKKNPGPSDDMESWGTLEEELFAAKAIVVGLLMIMGGRILIPLRLLEKAPYKGQLYTELTEDGMVVEYRPEEGQQPLDADDIEDDQLDDEEDDLEDDYDGRN